MKRKISVAIVLLIIMILGCVIKNKAMVVGVGDTSYLERAEKGFYTIQRWNGEEWIYVTYSITNYIDEFGQKRVAYCVDPNLKGIGYISGEFSGYNVELKNLITDEKSWRVLTNGYPYKTPEELNVESEQDAYLATKMALYAMLRGNNESDIRSLYRAGEDKVAGQSIEETNRRGAKVIDAICSLVNIGNNGTDKMDYSNTLKIETIGKLKEYEKNKEYYYQKSKVTSNVECSEYYIKDFTGFPEGTKITDESGIEETTFKGGDDFYIMIPKKSITEDIQGIVKITGTCKNYPIYYAKCMDGNYQNYVLCCDCYSRNIEASGGINIEAKKSRLKIKKVDKDTKNVLANVKFSVKYKDGKDIGIYTTDENGIINVDGLHQGQVIVKELETSKYYEIATESQIINILYNENKEIQIENEVKKGQIRIIKIDADNNEYRIEGAKFEIQDEMGNIVETLVTDNNGEAISKKLPINKKYIVKETETSKEYILEENALTVQLNQNEIKTLTFKNKKKFQEQKLPRTGSFDISLYLYITSAIAFFIKKIL